MFGSANAYIGSVSHIQTCTINKIIIEVIGMKIEAYKICNYKNMQMYGVKNSRIGQFNGIFVIVTWIKRNNPYHKRLQGHLKYSLVLDLTHL